MNKGWVLCPIEEDFIELEEMGFIIGKSRTIWMNGVDCYAYLVQGDDASVNELKPYWGRYYWSFFDTEGRKNERFDSKERKRQCEVQRSLMQSSLL
jgi:hypothetical protein